MSERERESPTEIAKALRAAVNPVHIATVNFCSCTGHLAVAAINKFQSVAVIEIDRNDRRPGTVCKYSASYEQANPLICITYIAYTVPSI